MKRMMVRVPSVKKYQYTQGFTLVEVLISVLVLGMGMLGIINLQSRALMDNQDAYLRSQAIFLAYNMSDRIRANADEWRVGVTDLSNYPVSFVPAYRFCSTYDPNVSSLVAVANPPATPANCTDTQVAAYDAYRWTADVVDMLPNGTVMLARVDDPNTATVSATEVIRLTVSWDRVSQHITASSPSYSLDVRL